MSVIEIAKFAGVSTATVSRVINYNSNVSKERAIQVRNAMKILGYNANKKDKKSSPKVSFVGLLVVSNHMFDPYSSVGHFMIKGAADALRKRGIDMILSYVTDPDDLPDYVVRKKHQGLIIMGHNPCKQLIDLLSEMPSVWMTSHKSSHGDIVLAGNEGVGKIAAEYLLSRGHKHIGVLNTLTTEAAGETRAKFFQFIGTELGAQVSVFCPEQSPVKIWDNDMDLQWFEDAVRNLVDKMLACDSRPTGLFVPSDFQAAMVYRVLQKRGIKPGFDIDIISTDDEKSALMGLYPRPATIDIGAKDIGACAVEYLLMNDSPFDKQRIQMSIKPQLISGEETNTKWS